MSDPDLPLTGGCVCGAVRFELDEAPLIAWYCHCTRCQRRSGAGAAPSAAARTEAFRLTGGDEAIRRWNAGDGNDKAFCGTCGSALFSQNPEEPDFTFIRMGLFDGDPGVRPTFRAHVASAAEWEPIPEDDTIRFPGFVDRSALG